MKNGLKKIISTAVFVLSLLCLSACSSNVPGTQNNPPVTNYFSEPEPMLHEPKEVSLLQIDNDDVFEKGYYEFFFDYEEEGGKNYQLITKAVFRRMWDTDTEWKIYVSERKIAESYLINYFESTEPTLINDGELEIHSGQWIYLYCEHNSSNSDEPNRSGYTIKYLFGVNPEMKEITKAEEFQNYLLDVYGIPESLSDGHYAICDVTGDGNDDYVTTNMTGSGMVRVQLIVYDVENHVDYVLDGYDYSYKIIGVEDGKLVVDEIGPYGYGDPLIETRGTAMIDEDDHLVFVKELSEKDLRDFGDFKEEWIKEKIKEISITSAEEIEYVRWVDDEKSTLQIGIKYERPREDRETDHKKDIFVFKDDIKPLTVDYSFTDKTGYARIVFADPTFESHFEDVNFDGEDELIIHRGTNPKGGLEMYSAYELKNGEYVFFPAFEWMYSYTVNEKDKTIECVRMGGAFKDKIIKSTYSYEDGEYFKIDERELSD